MPSGLQEKLVRINNRMAELLTLVRKSLEGQGEFGVDEIRIIRAALDEMEPVVAESASLRLAHPEAAGQLDLYKKQLSELFISVQRVQITLLARRAQMDASRGHLHSVSRWVTTLSQTRL